jgi:hypothetical protein
VRGGGGGPSIQGGAAPSFRGASPGPSIGSGAGPSFRSGTGPTVRGPAGPNGFAGNWHGRHHGRHVRGVIPFGAYAYTYPYDDDDVYDRCDDGGRNRWNDPWWRRYCGPDAQRYGW